MKVSHCRQQECALGTKLPTRYPHPTTGMVSDFISSGKPRTTGVSCKHNATVLSNKDNRSVVTTRHDNQMLRRMPKRNKKSTPGLQECGKKERAHRITGVRKEKDFPFSTSVASKNEQRWAFYFLLIRGKQEWNAGFLTAERVADEAIM